MARIDRKKALRLLQKAELLELGEMADAARKELHPESRVTFIVDRNINYTNVCINRCTFCAFYRDAGSPEAYVLSENELFRKIEETIALEGTQILLQGGLHPDLDMDYYTGLLRKIKERFEISIHGFSPPEVAYLAKRHSLTIRETLMMLRLAGLDSIPGGGAEILSDRVREVLSPKKIRTEAWLKVMEEAHRLGMRTTATMMFGSVETPEEIIDHLDAVRTLQDETGGFTAFIPWSFQPGNSELARKAEGGRRKAIKQTEINKATAVDYLRVLALSRIYLDNVRNLQASWVTQGLKMAQVALRFGANDFGSTMIEENVVRAAGVAYRVTKDDIISAIKSAGFQPAQRNTHYHILRTF
ncbi:MAG TPA: cyclic dehypoxanthinyl futalosine synthase [Dissulfurispiraceae bacterium]|nr:cyclic dehypoxanthinyl futalosine synthase [Dissulfurispiraceae bacterium]